MRTQQAPAYEQARKEEAATYERGLAVAAGLLRRRSRLQRAPTVERGLGVL